MKCISEDCDTVIAHYGMCDKCWGELAEMSRMPSLDKAPIPRWRRRALYPITEGNTMSHGIDLTGSIR